MPMNDLNETEFFTLLSSQKQIDYFQIQSAYEKFIEKVININQPDNEYTIIYRKLNLTRIELVSLSKHFRYEQGEKCA